MAKSMVTASLSPLDIDIIYGFADNGMKPGATGKAVYCDHRTVSYHLDNIYKKTKLNPRNFYDLCDLIEILNKELNDAERP